MVTFYRL